jgi:hypothetical protein
VAEVCSRAAAITLSASLCAALICLLAVDLVAQIVPTAASSAKSPAASASASRRETAPLCSAVSSLRLAWLSAHQPAAS